MTLLKTVHSILFFSLLINRSVVNKVNLIKSRTLKKKKKLAAFVYLLIDFENIINTGSKCYIKHNLNPLFSDNTTLLHSLSAFT